MLFVSLTPKMCKTVENSKFLRIQWFFVVNTEKSKKYTGLAS